MHNELIIQLALWQIAVTVGLIILNALIPVASMVGVVLRTAAILGVLFYTALAGLWLFPPWWTPFVLVLLQVFISWRQMRRLRTRAAAGSTWKIVEAGLSLAGLVGAVLLILPAIQRRTPPSVAIDLDMPLGPGRYLVISGGATPQLNAHFFTLNRPQAAAFRGQSYALDIIGINAMGLRSSGISPADPALYEIYGADVLAPCDGTVLAAIDGIADNQVPIMNRDAMTGNSVILDCDGLAVVLAHFIPQSLSVAEGDIVQAGQKIAQVGNSGNSGEPHLHVHVQESVEGNEPLKGEPLWFTINGAFPVRNSRFSVSQ